MSDKNNLLRSAFLIGGISFAGVAALLVLLWAFIWVLDFFERLGVQKDKEMTAFWENNRAAFNRMAENCDWKKDEKTFEYAAVTQECLDLAAKLKFKPFKLEESGSVIFISNMFKGYVYSKQEQLPLKSDLDAVPEIEIRPYSCVYRKLNENWYLQRCNPYEH